MLLGHPKSDVRAARQDRRIRITRNERGQRFDVARCKETTPRMFDREFILTRQPLQRRNSICGFSLITAGLSQPVCAIVCRHFAVHAARRSDDWSVSGTTTQIPGQRVINLPAVGIRVGLVQREQRHYETRRAKAALRSMVVDHGSLYGMQPATSRRQALDRNQLFAIERRQELDAGINRPHRKIVAISGQLGDHNGAGTAIALCATLFRSGAAEVLAKELQHSARRVDVVELDQLTIEYETDGRRTHAD